MNKARKIIGIILLVISVCLFLFAIYLFVGMLGCKETGCGDVIFVILPIVLVSILLLPIAILLITSSSTKTKQKANTVYIISAILFGPIGLHDFISGRKKQGLIHLIIFIVAIALMTLRINQQSRPLTTEECVAISPAFKTAADCSHMSVIENSGFSVFPALAGQIIQIANYIWALIELRHTNDPSVYSFMLKKQTPKQPKTNHASPTNPSLQPTSQTPSQPPTSDTQTPPHDNISA